MAPETTTAASGKPAIGALPRSGTVVPTQTGFSGPEDGLRSVGYLELGEDVRDVVAHGLGANEQESGDPGVVVALGYEVEYLPLAGGELGEGFCGRSRPGAEKKSVRRLAISAPK